MKFTEFCKQLEDKIKNSYEQGTSMEEAEKLAAEFLYAQMVVSKELTSKDLDARMKKSGNKAMRAGSYLNIVASSDKKPTEAQISAMIETDEKVNIQQNLMDTAEVEAAELQRYYDIFTRAELLFKKRSEGSFGG